MKILGKKYEINTVSENEFTGLHMGRSNTKLGKIFLSEAIREDIKAETMLHEVIHVLDDCLALSLSEEQVLRLSSGLFAVLAENGIKINFDNESQV